MNKLTVGIPTKDRGLEVSLLMYSLLDQTYQNFDILVVNDHSNAFLKQNTTFLSLIQLHKNLGRDVKIVEGVRKGPQYGGQTILDQSQTELIFRVDDDVTLRPNCLEELVKCFEDPSVGAVGPIYILPGSPIQKQIIYDDKLSNECLESTKVKREKEVVFISGFAQVNLWPNLHENIPTEHLHSGFMYRKTVLRKCGGYFLGYSKVGHREETDVSYRIHLSGHKLLICPKAIAFHYHPMSGGIRTDNGQFNPEELWQNDEKIFINRLRSDFKEDIPKQSTPVKKYDHIKQEIDENCSAEIHVVTVTHGDGSKLFQLLDQMKQFTDTKYTHTIIWNDDVKVEDYNSIVNKLSGYGIFALKLTNNISVSEARNIGASLRPKNSKYICFVDDDAQILGKWSTEDDWLSLLLKRFNEPKPNYQSKDTGAISPIFTYFEDLHSWVLSVACLFTSVDVWNKVGGFDTIFGNRDQGTWGYEDTDWSYRVQLLGYDINGMPHKDFPFYHEDTTGKKKADWQEEGLIKAKQLLLEKHKNSDAKHHIGIVTYGNHEKLETLLEDIFQHTDTKFSLTIVNNDSSEESHKKLKKLIPFIQANFNRKKFEIEYVNLDKEVSVSEARNKCFEFASSKTEYLCILDDDARIVAKSEPDWLKLLENEFNSEPNIGAVGPIFHWFPELKSHVLFGACIFTSVKVWNNVGKFDPVFGNDKKNTWAYDDIDWTYRVQLSGYKLKGMDIKSFPFYHGDTSGQGRKPNSRDEKSENAKKILLSKYDVKEVEQFERLQYPFTKDQISVASWPGQKLLNVGCHHMKLENFINIDINEECKPDVLADIRELECEEESVSLILASHVIEHLKIFDIRPVLSKFYKWLKPGGHLIVEVPDVGKIMNLVSQGKATFDEYKEDILGNDQIKGQKHEMQFDFSSLLEVLKEAGFTNIVRNNDTSGNSEVCIRYDVVK